jgi:hypothetical protein
MALPKLALHPGMLQISIYITEANKQQVVKSFVQNIGFMINAVPYS